MFNVGDMLCRWFPVLLIVLACLVAENFQAVHGGEIKGVVVGVHDGDSLTVLTTEKSQIKVRLEGIDAPELNQAFGNASKKALSDLVFGKTVRLVETGRDRYKRTLGNVYVGVIWVNLAVTERGMAWFFAKYSKDDRLRFAEEEARQRKVGLWIEVAPQPPWEWRAKRKKNLTTVAARETWSLV